MDILQDFTKDTFGGHCSRAYSGNGGGCEHGCTKEWENGQRKGKNSYCKLNNRFLERFSGCPKEI